MFESFSRSWQMVKASYNVLRSDKELIWFPIISAIGMVVVTILFLIPLAASGLLEALAQSDTTTTGTTTQTVSDSQAFVGFVIMFLFYFVTYTIIIFCNTALVGAALIRMRGGDPTLRDGFRIASERIGTIIAYAAISATVGMILQAIRRNRDNFLAQLFAGILSFAWNIATFLVIPVLVVENVGPIEAIKRSSGYLKRTWGEQLVGSFSISGIFFLISLAVMLVVGLPLVLIASAANSPIVWGLAITIIVIALMAVSLIGSALSGIFQAALYRYAAEGASTEQFDPSMIQGAFLQR
jgi:hypothetical protein